MGTGICPFCGKKVDKFIMFRGDVVGCRYCGIHTKQTNADRIRAMTDDELADEILSWFNWLNAVEWDDKRIIEWLKQEVSTDG